MMNKRVCFLTIRNIFNTSCLPKYASILSNNFDLIYWDQHNIHESSSAKRQYKFNYPIAYGQQKFKKIIGYIKFKIFATKIIKQNNYERIIVLPTQTAILFFLLLTFKYKKKFIIDIRDYSGEKNIFIYFLVRILVKLSGVAVITSPAYKTFLPNHSYLVSHNITPINTELIKKFRKRKRFNKDKIIISCIGSIRFIEQFKKVINVFGNDNRYELYFIGRGSENLTNYCNENQINNVNLIGRFNKEKTLDYYLNTDIVMNLYGNNNPYLDYALSNKLYYAAQLGLPILVCPGTYIEQIALEYGFGFSFELEDNTMKDKLYDYYTRMEWEKFYDNCDRFIKRVMEQEELFKHNIKEFVEKG